MYSNQAREEKLKKLISFGMERWRPWTALTVEARSLIQQPSAESTLGQASCEA